MTGAARYSRLLVGIQGTFIAASLAAGSYVGISKPNCPPENWVPYRLPVFVGIEVEWSFWEGCTYQDFCRYHCEPARSKGP